MLEATVKTLSTMCSNQVCAGSDTPTEWGLIDYPNSCYMTEWAQASAHKEAKNYVVKKSLAISPTCMGITGGRLGYLKEVLSMRGQ